MIDAKKRLGDVVKENALLKEKLETAHRELAESVRSEIELKIAVARLAEELQLLKKSSSPKTCKGKLCQNKTKNQ